MGFRDWFRRVDQALNPPNPTDAAIQIFPRTANMPDSAPSEDECDRVRQSIGLFMTASLLMVRPAGLDRTPAQRLAICAYLFGACDALAQRTNMSDVHLVAMAQATITECLAIAPETAAEAVCAVMATPALEPFVNGGGQGVIAWLSGRDQNAPLVLFEMLSASAPEASFQLLLDRLREKYGAAATAAEDRPRINESVEVVHFVLSRSIAATAKTPDELTQDERFVFTIAACVASEEVSRLAEVDCTKVAVVASAKIWHGVVEARDVGAMIRDAIDARIEMERGAKGQQMILALRGAVVQFLNSLDESHVRNLSTMTLALSRLVRTR